MATHQFVWLPAEKRVGGCRLHCTLTEGQELMRSVGLMFRRDGERGHPLWSIWGSERRAIFLFPLEGPDVTGVRLGLAQSADGPFLQAVQFAPKLRP